MSRHLIINFNHVAAFPVLGPNPSLVGCTSDFAHQDLGVMGGFFFLMLACANAGKSLSWMFCDISYLKLLAGKQSRMSVLHFNRTFKEPAEVFWGGYSIFWGISDCRSDLLNSVLRNSDQQTNKSGKTNNER